MLDQVADPAGRHPGGFDVSEATVTAGRSPAAGRRGSPTRAASSADPFGGVGDGGSSFTIALAGLVAMAQGLGAAGVRLLQPGAAGLTTVVGFALAWAVAYAWLRRDRRPQRQAAAGRAHRMWVMLPGVLMVGYVLIARVLPVGRRTEWYVGGDHVRHLILASDVQATGSLSYSAEAYPRAWHTLLAAVWSALGLRPQTDIAVVVDVSAVLVWMLSAGLALTTSALAGTLAHRLGLASREAAAAGLVAGSVTLLPAFLGNYQGLGFQTSLLAAGVLATVVRAQLARPGSLATLTVAAAGVVVVAHTWQLLLPVVGLVALRCALDVSRRRGRPAAWASPGLAVLALAVLTLAVSAPSLLAVTTQIGVQHATDAGVHAPVPWAILALGAGAAIGLGARARSPERQVLALMAVPAVTGLALAAYVRITPDTYYASKLIWQSAALLLAPLSVAAMFLALRVVGLGRPVGPAARVLGGGAAVIVLAYALLAPIGAYVGAWSTVEGEKVLRLLSTAGAGEAQVVWSGGAVHTDTVTRVLLDALRPMPAEPATPQQPLSVAEECALLGTGGATVLTDQPDDAVRARYRCAPDLRILRAR